MASMAKLCSLGYNLTLSRKCDLRFGAETRGADRRPDRYQITRYQITWYQITWYQITMAKLPAEGTQARRFGKTRSAQSTALLEDYAELIADLLTGEGEARPTDIARRFGVSHATAIKTISRLKRAGLATARPYRGVFLTEKGHALADRVRVRHRLVVDLLRALGVPTEAAEADAEGIEHHVSEITLKAFAQFLKTRG